MRTILRISGPYHLSENGYHRQVDWAEHTRSRLSEAGYRSGGARRRVIELLDAQSCCLTAQEVHDRLRADGRTVGIASVYRVLDLLAELRLVQRVDVGGGPARYEPVQPTGEHHHHAVCDDCGKVEAFADESLERAIHAAGGVVPFLVRAHEVVLHGSCSDCRTAA